MKVLVIGGHGRVAMRLHPLLVTDGHKVAAVIRNPDHAADVSAAGAEPVVADLEASGDLSGYLEGYEALIFSAGAGKDPGPNNERRRAVDRDLPQRLIAAAKKVGLKRFIIVSAIDAVEPGGTAEDRLNWSERNINVPATADVPTSETHSSLSIYTRAKIEADNALRASGLDYTIVRPGLLSDEAGTGRIALAKELPLASIPRGDVAAVLAFCLKAPNTIRQEFDITAGPKAIADAIKAV